ncbi:MAG: hypothetical protein M0C28_32365 [Candidatus Moduliflexus flocculans]|nr:hypothetical protein [Candidatus Moduliflexus flocculans]
MRLAQKGYAVGVVEAGKRWHADDFARRNWNLRKFLWLPAPRPLRDLAPAPPRTASSSWPASGVGGGSLNYANTLYVPPDVFFERPSVRRLGGRDELLPVLRPGRRACSASSPIPSRRSRTS